MLTLDHIVCPFPKNIAALQYLEQYNVFESIRLAKEQSTTDIMIGLHLYSIEEQNEDRFISLSKKKAAELALMNPGRMTIESILQFALQSSSAEYICLSSADTYVRTDFYHKMDWFLRTGHDLIALQSHNAFVPRFERFKPIKFVIHSWIWSETAPNPYMDALIIKRELLQKIVNHATLINIPYAFESIFLQLLPYALQPKIIHESAYILQANAKRVWQSESFWPLIEHNAGIVDTLKDYTHELHAEIKTKVRVHKESIVHTSIPTPVIQKPAIPIEYAMEHLPGTTWLITTYFNASNSVYVYQNFITSVTSLKAQGAKILVMYTVYETDTYEFPGSLVDKVIRLTSKDILWQKERLFNAALEYLPDDCDKVVFFDADIQFTNENWLAQTASALEYYVCIQPFSQVIRLKEGQEFKKDMYAPIGWHDGGSYESMAYAMHNYGENIVEHYPAHGTVGLALAIRRSVIQKHGWYDSDVIGNGDLLLLHAFVQKLHQFTIQSLNFLQRPHYTRWLKTFYTEVGSSLFYIPGTVTHLWHGDTTQRMYVERNHILETHNFNPLTDVKKSPTGAWQWTNKNLALQTAVKEYFLVKDIT